jgi:hypothetical protein
MLAIVRNPAGFHVINVLGKGCNFNIIHHTTEALPPLGEWRRDQVGASDRKLIVHAGKSHPHRVRIFLTFLDENDMTKVLHPRYPLDLAPLGSFFLATLSSSSEEMNFPIGIRFSTQLCIF